MLYDDQASTFDERAGFPDGAVDSIGEALVNLVGVRAHDRWLEIGAGTGLLSVPLLRQPIDYIGFDKSPQMIRVFHRRLAELGAVAQLYVADGGQQWPVDDRTINVVFSSRALHHLGVDHIMSELKRVLVPDGGCIVVGTVGRPRDSVRSAMRRAMRDRLEQMGFTGRSHERHSSELFEVLQGIGGTRIGPVVAARWTRLVSPADSINDWMTKQGLAGVELSDAQKSALLDDLHAWTVAEFGDATKPVEQEEWYELEGVRTGRSS